jgi:chromosomal replication initiation ATPase DnaA
MSFDGHYYDSGRQSKPAEKPILSDEDVARCEAISARRGTPMPEIVRAVSEATGIKTTDIYGTSRVPAIAQARHIVMYACARHGMRTARIAKLLDRDVSTVLHGIRAEKERRGEL